MHRPRSYGDSGLSARMSHRAVRTDVRQHTHNKCPAHPGNWVVTADAPLPVDASRLPSSKRSRRSWRRIDLPLSAVTNTTFSVSSPRSPRKSFRRLAVALEALSTDLSTTRVIGQRQCPMKQIEQLASADVLDLMFVFVGATTERAVVVPEPHGSFCVGMLHGVGNTASRVICYRYRVFNIFVSTSLDRRRYLSGHMLPSSCERTDTPRRRWGWYEVHGELTTG